MPRPATGQIVEHRGKDGRIYRSLRFRAAGSRHTKPLGVVSRDNAEAALRHTMADVERGTWTPPAAPSEPAPDAGPLPSFHAFAEHWWRRHENRLAEKTREDYCWRLEKHLIPFLGGDRVDAITFARVDEYIAEKLAEGERIRKAAAEGEPLLEKVTDKQGRVFMRRLRPLSARSINMTLVLLGAILEHARKSGVIEQNPARDRDLRVRERAPRRSYLDNAAHIEALLSGGGELDRSAQEQGRHIERRAMLATLCFAGLRIGELLALRWRDVDLKAGWLTVGEAKTDAGVRRVRIRGALMRELARLDGTDGYVFSARTGRQLSAENFRNRVLAPAVNRANEKLAKGELAPLPDNLTPHSLRRTFCSVLYALGEDPGTVMDEMGHASPTLALRIYRQAMRRDEDEKARLCVLVEGVDWADTGEPSDERAAEVAEEARA